MKPKYNESDFDGVYRGEKIPIETISKANENGDGFMINKPLYADMLNGLTKEENKKIKTTIFDILDGRIKSKFTGALTPNTDGAFEIPKNKLENVYNSDNISIDIQFSSKENGKNHNGFGILTMNNKKYFAKAIKHGKRIIVPIEEERYTDLEHKTSIPLSAKSEYKGQEYLDDFAKYNKDINVVKPIIAFDAHKQHFIIYPYIEGLQLLSDVKEKNPQLYSWIHQKYISYINLIDSKGKVLDIKNLTNIFFDPSTEKIYIFDSVYNDN